MTDKIADQITKIIKSNDIVLFMKGTAEQPRCGFSDIVCKILNHYKVSYQDVNVLDSDEMRQGIKDFSDWPTIPQLYVKEEFIGGCDIIREMYNSGDLEKMFRENGVI